MSGSKVSPITNQNADATFDLLDPQSNCIGKNLEYFSCIGPSDTVLLKFVRKD